MMKTVSTRTILTTLQSCNMSSGKWKGLRLGTQDGLPVLERIARQKDAAYILMLQGNVPDMVRKLQTVVKMQDSYENFTGREVPSLLDYECLAKPETVVNKRDNFKEY